MSKFKKTRFIHFDTDGNKTEEEKIGIEIDIRNVESLEDDDLNKKPIKDIGKNVAIVLEEKDVIRIYLYLHKKEIKELLKGPDKIYLKTFTNGR